MSKNICFFNTTPFWGGGEHWHLEMAKAMKERGYYVLIFAGKLSELSHRAKKHEIDVFEIDLSNLSFINPFKHNIVRKVLREKKIDVIVINAPNDLKVAGISAKAVGVKKIIYRRGSPIPVKDSLSNRYLFNHVLTDIIVNSNSIKKELLINNDQIVSHDKIKLLYNSIDIEKFNSLSKTNSYSNEFIIGALGRLSYEKGFDMLIEVAKILNEKGFKYKILIGGKGDEENNLKTKVYDLKLHDRIFFEGFITNVDEFYKKLDVFVLTSRWEGFANVLNEAMLFKLPLVAFNVSSIPEIITNGVNGYLIEKNDIAGMAEKIMLLCENSALRKEMGERGHDFVKNNFDKNVIIEQFIEIISSKY